MAGACRCGSRCVLQGTRETRQGPQELRSGHRGGPGDAVRGQESPSGPDYASGARAGTRSHGDRGGRRRMGENDRSTRAGNCHGRRCGPETCPLGSSENQILDAADEDAVTAERCATVLRGSPRIPAGIRGQLADTSHGQNRSVPSGISSHAGACRRQRGRTRWSPRADTRTATYLSHPSGHEVYDWCPAGHQRSYQGGPDAGDRAHGSCREVAGQAFSLIAIWYGPWTQHRGPDESAARARGTTDGATRGCTCGALTGSSGRRLGSTFDGQRGVTLTASFSPGNRGLLPFGTCRLGGPPHSSLIGTDSCVDVRLGQGSVVGVADLEFLGAELIMCTVLQVYIGALSWDASFLIRPPPDLLGSLCAETIETHGLGAPHRDRCMSSSPLEPEHWVCASDFGGPPCRFPDTDRRMTARFASPPPTSTRSWPPSHLVAAWDAIGQFAGPLRPRGFKSCNGSLRCTSVAQGCTPITCKLCEFTEVSGTNLSWDSLSLGALLLCVVFCAGIALTSGCSSVTPEVSLLGLLGFGRSTRPAWAARAPHGGPATSWGLFGFILGFATILARLHPTVVGAHGIMICHLLSDLETHAVSLSLTFCLVVLGQLLALPMRALGFHRTPGGRCILWCDTSHVALMLCSLAAASRADSSPLLWRVCISDAACPRRYERQCRQTAGAQPNAYTVLWRPVPKASFLAGFTREAPHYHRHGSGVALSEALGPCLRARRLMSQHWMCKCFTGCLS